MPFGQCRTIYCQQVFHDHSQPLTWHQVYFLQKQRSLVGYQEEWRAEPIFVGEWPRALLKVQRNILMNYKSIIHIIILKIFSE